MEDSAAQASSGLQSPQARWRLTSHALYYKLPYETPQSSTHSDSQTFSIKKSEYSFLTSLKSKDGKLQKNINLIIDSDYLIYRKYETFLQVSPTYLFNQTFTSIYRNDF